MPKLYPFFDADLGDEFKYILPAIVLELPFQL